MPLGPLGGPQQQRRRSARVPQAGILRPDGHAVSPSRRPRACTGGGKLHAVQSVVRVRRPAAGPARARRQSTRQRPRWSATTSAGGPRGSREQEDGDHQRRAGQRDRAQERPSVPGPGTRRADDDHHQQEGAQIRQQTTEGDARICAARRSNRTEPEGDDGEAEPEQGAAAPVRPGRPALHAVQCAPRRRSAVLLVGGPQQRADLVVDVGHGAQPHAVGGRARAPSRAPAARSPAGPGGGGPGRSGRPSRPRRRRTAGGARTARTCPAPPGRRRRRAPRPPRGARRRSAGARPWRRRTARRRTPRRWAAPSRRSRAAASAIAHWLFCFTPCTSRSHRRTAFWSSGSTPDAATRATQSARDRPVRSAIESVTALIISSGVGTRRR